jgi:hypothetical protein
MRIYEMQQDTKDIYAEMQRVSADGNILVGILRNGKVRVSDNHYGILKPIDCDPVSFYIWLTTLPDGLFMREFIDKFNKEYMPTMREQ